jgi:hypothetical protein
MVLWSEKDYFSKKKRDSTGRLAKSQRFDGIPLEMDRTLYLPQ